MNDTNTIKTILAVLVVEKVITKKKAQDALYRIETSSMRGVMPPLDLQGLVNLLGDDK